LSTTAWHEVQVLKFVHSRFVLLRADLALQQRGQAQLLTSLVESLDAWLTDRAEYDRLPRRLHDLVELADDEYAALARTDPGALAGSGWDPPADRDSVRALARGRAVIDFLASLTDGQAAALLDALTGRTTQLWTDTFVL
jgi:dGTPase